MKDHKIIISFKYPPIPIRSFDYVAYFEEDAENQDESGLEFFGRGATVREAVLELIDSKYPNES